MYSTKDYHEVKEALLDQHSDMSSFNLIASSFFNQLLVFGSSSSSKIKWAVI